MCHPQSACVACNTKAYWRRVILVAQWYPFALLWSRIPMKKGTLGGLNWAVLNQSAILAGERSSIEFGRLPAKRTTKSILSSQDHVEVFEASEGSWVICAALPISMFSLCKTGGTGLYVVWAPTLLAFFWRGLKYGLLVLI